MEEKFIVQLRDCFTAGYTMPQFCVDNDIKKPLIVGIDDSQQNFLWEIYIQFKYDKRLVAKFGLIKGKVGSVNFSVHANSVPDLTLKNISEINDEAFDKIIILSTNNSPHPKIIYLQTLTDYFIKRAYCEIPLLHFVDCNPGVKLIGYNNPGLIENEYNTPFEKWLLNEHKKPQMVLGIEDETEISAPHDFVGHLRKEIANAQVEGKTISTPYDFLGYSNQTVYDLLETPDQKVNIDGSISFCDNEFLKIRNGHRVTVNQPEKYQNTIYFVGNCVAFGYGVPFDKTLESHLQNLLNENKFPYKVENFSLFITRRRQDTFYFLDKIKPKRGDIIFFIGSPSPNIPYLNLRDILKRPHNYGEVFVDVSHINENGHRAVADYIFNVLVSNNFFKDTDFKYPLTPPPIHRYGIPKEKTISPTTFSQNKELEEYKAKLREKRFQVGAIVMNCNPFTLGHEYLIEYASKKVKKLYIFVVEEDKSEFKFADRFELVKRGVKKFSNVEVLPSGKFIISQQTFSGYFNKENLQDVAVDSSEDVEIFAREIAPSLGITVRFVGEEPEDSVTRQYNENMKNILPKYNIDFCEIPRREIGGEVISAKKVRAALKVGDFDTIKKLVPKTTLKFLRENFS